MIPHVKTYRVRVRNSIMSRTAGEVRFVKDKSDSDQWAFNDSNQQERLLRILTDYTFRPKNVKPLACALRSTLMSLGHAMSAYTRFSKIKSTTVSPDGMLGGKGYILKIKDMRQMFMNAVEALSALSDTLYDEVNAPHWEEATKYLSEEEQKELDEVIEDVEDIREDPEDFAKSEEKEMDDEGVSKTASRKMTRAARMAHAYMTAHQVVEVLDGDRSVWVGELRHLMAHGEHGLSKLAFQQEVEVPAKVLRAEIASHEVEVARRLAHLHLFQGHQDD